MRLIQRQNLARPKHRMLERTSPFGETGVLNNSHYANIVEEIPCSLCSELLSVVTSLSQQLREVSVTVHGATEPAKVGMSAQGPAASGRPSDARGAPAHAQDADTQASNRQRPRLRVPYVTGEDEPSV